MNEPRKCNGGPNGTSWCGKRACYVARAPDGLEWFCCSEHTEGAVTTPIAEWFTKHGLPVPGAGEA
jgi:hypothetical protein